MVLIVCRRCYCPFVPTLIEYCWLIDCRSKTAIFSGKSNLNTLTPVISDNWSVKAIRRKTTGTGRMRHLRHLPRRFSNNFREGKFAHTSRYLHHTDYFSDIGSILRTKLLPHFLESLFSLCRNPGSSQEDGCCSLEWKQFLLHDEVTRLSILFHLWKGCFVI